MKSSSYWTIHPAKKLQIIQKKERFGMAVITISRQFGSRGNEVAERVSQILGYHIFDKTQLSNIASEEGLSTQEIIDFSEDNYKVKNFLDRLLGRSNMAGRIRVHKLSTGGVPITEMIEITEENAVALIQKAIRAAYEASSMVIVGRGGHQILKGYPDVLHARIIAPMENRILTTQTHIREEQQAYGERITVRRAAQDMITEHDASSAEYIEKFYNVDWDDPANFHAIFNTSMIPPEEIAEIIVEMSRRL